ncbi:MULTISPECIES: hypothetical protein [Limnospira]|uniref:hypothetical protein n=1 Tax=Limnospira TaxID=2596745 RepID=UPI0002480F88|nr:hypothetical protein [Limnospira indica]
MRAKTMLRSISHFNLKLWEPATSIFDCGVVRRSHYRAHYRSHYRAGCRVRCRAGLLG